MDDEEEDEDTSNEMQEFRGISYMDPSPGSCSATQLSCGFDSAGGGGAAGASLNSAVQALTINASRLYLHLSNPSAWRRIPLAAVSTETTAASSTRLQVLRSINS